MKQLSLLVLVVSFYTSFGQNMPAQHADLKLDKAETAQLQQLIRSKTKAATLFNCTFIGWADTIYYLNGASTTFSVYQNPIFMDSTVKAEFSNTTQFINNHAIGTTYDPTSVIWGQHQLSSVDPYYVDRIYFRLLQNP